MKLWGGYWPKSAVCSIRPASMMQATIFPAITLPTILLTIILLTMALAGCSQHDSSPTAEEAASVDQHLPFARRAAKTGIFPTSSLAPTAIPAGTSLAVHLRMSLSSATSRPGDSFEAILDEPIFVRGRMVAPRGAVVTGKVLDARPAGEFQEAGYLRLALIAVSLNGQSLAMQTSSIFVKRGSHAKGNFNEVIGTSIDRTSIGSPSIKDASISNVSMSKTSMSKPSISQASINKKPTLSLAGSGNGTLIGTSTGPAGAALDTDFATEDKDVGVAPERRLIFRLAQPIPLEM
jgi:hypothetical protein